VPLPQPARAGKNVTGRKRHILIDTLGLLFGVSVFPANVQDRDGFPICYARCDAFADASSQRPKMAKVVGATGSWKLEIGKRSEPAAFQTTAQLISPLEYIARFPTKTEILLFPRRF
jgi:hypothetical protein